MPNPHGAFIWYELMTPDPDAAARFYAGVTGWRQESMPGGMDYRILHAADARVGGMMTMPEGARPAWLGYVGVEDADATAAAFAAAGGKIRVPPTDIPGIGRFALLDDPQGAMLYVMRPVSDGTSTAFAPDGLGHCQWNELATTDPEAAFAFHAARFGWEKGEPMPMGEMGTYQILTHHGAAFGAVLRNPQPDGGPVWTYYFGVADIDAAAEAVRAGGGSVLHGPAPVPGDLFIIVAADPQGAVFGLVGRRG